MKRFVVLIVCWMASAAAPAQTPPGFYPLGVPSGTQWGQARALSRDGGIAVGFGISDTVASFAPGYSWSLGTGRIDFGLQPGLPPASLAYGVSTDGATIVGYMGSQTPYPARAYRRTGTGPLEDLGGFGVYESSYAWGVSGDGQVVVGALGHEFGSGFSDQAFRWTSQGGMQALGFLPGTFDSEARSISRDGSTIVGRSGGGAFVWRESTAMQALPGLLGAGSIGIHARGANANGTVIVGNAIAPDTIAHMVRWVNGSTQDLGILSGSSYSRGEATSDNGLVIGGFSNVFPDVIATVWTPATGIVPLTDYLGLFNVSIPIGWTLNSIYAISGDGMVFAGEARSPAGVRQGFVAAVPEPPALALLVPALFMLAKRRR